MNQHLLTSLTTDNENEALVCYSVAKILEGLASAPLILTKHLVDKREPNIIRPTLLLAPKKKSNRTMNQYQDHYSEQTIHPGDKVCALWDFEAKNDDELNCIRGSMIRVIELYSDHWALGQHIGMHSQSLTLNSTVTWSTPPLSVSGQRKKFPLICVCLGRHWSNLVRRVIADNRELEALSPQKYPTPRMKQSSATRQTTAHRVKETSRISRRKIARRV